MVSPVMVLNVMTIMNVLATHVTPMPTVKTSQVHSNAVAKLDSGPFSTTSQNSYSVTHRL